MLTEAQRAAITPMAFEILRLLRGSKALTGRQIHERLQGHTRRGVASVLSKMVRAGTLREYVTDDADGYSRHHYHLEP